MSTSTSYDLDDLHSDVGHLYHLIDTIADAMLQEVSFEAPDGSRAQGVDRVNALAWIARDAAKAMDENIGAHYAALRDAVPADLAPAFAPAAGSSSTLGGMSIYDLYVAINAMVLVRQVMNLQVCASGNGDASLFEWAEAREAELDAHLEALIAELDSRPDTDADDPATRTMALHRASGLLGGREL